MSGSSSISRMRGVGISSLGAALGGRLIADVPVTMVLQTSTRYSVPATQRGTRHGGAGEEREQQPELDAQQGEGSLAYGGARCEQAEARYGCEGDGCRERAAQAGRGRAAAGAAADALAQRIERTGRREHRHQRVEQRRCD